MSSVRPTARGERDTAVLRLAALGDVELRENLQPRRHAGGHLLRDALHLAEHAVDAEAHGECVLLRLEVDVGGVFLRRLEDERVHEANERAVRDAVVGLEVVAVVRFGLVQVDGDDGTDRLGRSHEPLELGEDVVAGSNPELERMLRRETSSSMACRFPGIRDRDLEHVALERIRDGDGALERLHRNQLGGVDGDTDAGRSTIGRWCLTASIRATPSDVAAPSSMSACVTGVPAAARSRTSASASGRRGWCARGGRG